MINVIPDFLAKVSEALGLDTSEEVGEISVDDIVGSQGP